MLPLSNDQPVSASINGLIDPIAEYDHGQGYANVIGGHVYRGSLISELQGFYVCGDYGQIFGNSGELFYLDIEGGVWSSSSIKW